MVFWASCKARAIRSELRQRGFRCERTGNVGAMGPLFAYSIGTQDVDAGIQVSCYEQTARSFCRKPNWIAFVQEPGMFEFLSAESGQLVF